MTKNFLFRFRFRLCARFEIIYPSQKCPLNCCVPLYLASILRRIYESLFIFIQNKTSTSLRLQLTQLCAHNTQFYTCTHTNSFFWIFINSITSGVNGGAAACAVRMKRNTPANAWICIQYTLALFNAFYANFSWRNKTKAGSPTIMRVWCRQRILCGTKNILRAF